MQASNPFDVALKPNAGQGIDHGHARIGQRGAALSLTVTLIVALEGIHRMHFQMRWEMLNAIN